jgi:hypothetical protein
MGRPFPFDKKTVDAYDASFWCDRTGWGQLAQVLFLKDTDLMVQLAFYGDGSGEHGKGTFVVAGYLSGTVDWFDIECQWKEELEREPILRYFKSSECLHLDGQFEGWNRVNANWRRSKFIDIIARNGSHLAEISSYVDWDGWRSVIGSGVFKQAFYHPYFFCFNGAVAETITHVNERCPWHSGRIAFVMDTESNGTLDTDVQNLYNEGVKSLPREFSTRMGSTSWDSDEAMPILQIADMAAWSIRAAKVGLDSPLADIRKNVAWRREREWIPSRMAEFVRQTEEQFRIRYPQSVSL